MEVCHVESAVFDDPNLVSCAAESVNLYEALICTYY